MTDLHRRTVVRAVGAAGLASVGATGVASANITDTIAFCGCSQVVVYGEDLDDQTYLAVLYCGDPPTGSFACAELTGSATRKSYETDDCKIVAVVGQTNPRNDGRRVDRPFVVCNQYGPQRCSASALRGWPTRESELIDCLVERAESSGPNRLTLVGQGESLKYEATVSGRFTGGGNLEGGESASGSSVTGRVGIGDDVYTYTGTLESVRFINGHAPVVVDGNPSDRNDGLVVNPRCGFYAPSDLGITVRSGGCGPEDAGGGPPDEKGNGPNSRGGRIERR